MSNSLDLFGLLPHETLPKHCGLHVGSDGEWNTVSPPNRHIPRQVTVCLMQTGNEAVVRARFQDAQFFFQEDLKRPLAEFRELLSGTLFQKDLGTLLDKSVSALCSKHC